MDDNVPPLAAAIRSLSRARPELGLVAEPASPPLRPLAEIVRSEGLEDWLAGTATLGPGIDRKTAAAYLLSILVWRLGEILGALHLDGVPLPPLAAEDVHASMAVRGSGRARDIQFRFALGSPRLGGTAFDLATLRRSIVAIHEPLVAALHRRTGLSQSALWRLVTDGISAGLLTHGGLHGTGERARRDAEALLDAPPLRNRQWRFVRVEADGHADWFRLRGGCCRLYKAEGQEYCTTCVVRPTGEQLDRLHFLVRTRGA